MFTSVCLCLLVFTIKSFPHLFIYLFNIILLIFHSLVVPFTISLCLSHFYFYNSYFFFSCSHFYNISSSVLLFVVFLLFYYTLQFLFLFLYVINLLVCQRILLTNAKMALTKQHIRNGRKSLFFFFSLLATVCFRDKTYLAPNGRTFWSPANLVLQWTQLRIIYNMKCCSLTSLHASLSNNSTKPTYNELFSTVSFSQSLIVDSRTSTYKKDFTK